MSFSCTDKDTLVAYIYGECDAATRGAVDAHLAACPACADEVAGFGVVRESLSQWTAPERVGRLPAGARRGGARAPRRRRCCGRPAGGSRRCRRSRGWRRPSCWSRAARRWRTSRSATTRTASSSGPAGRRPAGGRARCAAGGRARRAAPQPVAAVAAAARARGGRPRAVARRSWPRSSGRCATRSASRWRPCEAVGAGAGRRWPATSGFDENRFMERVYTRARRERAPPAGERRDLHEPPRERPAGGPRDRHAADRHRRASARAAAAAARRTRTCSTCRSRSRSRPSEGTRRHGAGF